MADIEIVIKIPEEDYEYIKNSNNMYLYVIKNGTPLPKGHGRLIDESKIKNCGWNFIDHHAKTDAPTIIEADTTYNPCDTNPFGDDRFGG